VGDKIDRSLRPKILLLALGNDLLGDDGVAWSAARLIEPSVQGRVDVVATAEAGLALLEPMTGYERVLILDAVTSGESRPGAVREFSPTYFPPIQSPSPHYAGLPEVVRLAGELGLPFPRDIRLLAMEIEDRHDIREGLSREIEAALPDFAAEAIRILTAWLGHAP
jgi:hydrogenase maturation protease